MEKIVDMSRLSHLLACEAPICVDDQTPDWRKNVIWYPGELVCTKRPYQQFQKIQNRINKLYFAGKLKEHDTYYTAEIMGKRTAVLEGTKGIPRNRYVNGYLAK